MTLTFNLAHDLGLGFSKLNFQTAISQEWESQSTCNERGLSPIRGWTHNATLDIYRFVRGLEHIPNTLAA